MTYRPLTPDMDTDLSWPDTAFAYRVGFTCSSGQWRDCVNPYKPVEQKILYDAWASGYEDGLRKLKDG